MTVKVLQEVGEVFLVRLSVGKPVPASNNVCHTCEACHHYAEGYKVSQEDQGVYLRGIVYSLTLCTY